MLKDERDYEEVLYFFEELLRADSECRLEHEYPLAFCRKNLDHIFVARVQNEPVAGLASLERRVEVSSGEFARALFVGSVVTKPEVRRQGFQRHLFHAAEEFAENAGIDFLVLWSNQIDFYTKLGFKLGGLQATWIPSKLKSEPRPQKSVYYGLTHSVPFRSSYFEEFHKKNMVVERSLEEMRALWQIPKMYVACTDRAYALVGKGEDFENICHEWAGPADEVLACMDRLIAEFKNLKILSPGIIHHSDEADLISNFEQRQYDCQFEYLGLFKMVSKRFSMNGLDPENLKYPFFIWGLDSI